MTSSGTPRSGRDRPPSARRVRPVASHRCRPCLWRAPAVSSRLGAHDRAARDQWLWRSGELYEGWIHVASLAPVEVWPWLHHRRAAVRPGARLEALLREDPHLLDRVRDEVAEHGRLTVSDLTQPGTRTGPWWGNPAGKVALDHLARTGRLAAQGLGTLHDLADHHRLGLGPAGRALQRLVARIDLKADRPAGRLLVRNAFSELAAWLALDDVVAEDGAGGDLIAPLAMALR